jgi:hypothetical protein
MKFILVGLFSLLSAACVENGAEPNGGIDKDCEDAPAVKPYDLEDRVHVTHSDDDEVDDVVRARCPDTHPVLLTGGCEFNYEFAAAASFPLDETEEGNAGWECRIGAIAPGTRMTEVTLYVAHAVCVR